MGKKISTALVLTLIMLSSSLFAGEVNLSVAASLKEVINELSANFAKKNKNITFKKNYGASGSLAKQIENGAPADIFISANTKWMDYLKDKNFTDKSSITIFTFNELVFAGKPDLKISRMDEIEKLDKIAIGSPKSVPAGEYAMQSLKKSGLDQKVGKKLVMAKDVRECLLYADRGEVDGAFVYRTDALMGKNVKILFAVPQEYYSQVTYPMTLTSTGAKKAEAAAFYKFLKSDEAKQVLKKYGFIFK